MYILGSRRGCVLYFFVLKIYLSSSSLSLNSLLVAGGQGGQHGAREARNACVLFLAATSSQEIGSINTQILLGQSVVRTWASPQG